MTPKSLSYSDNVSKTLLFARNLVIRPVSTISGAAVAGARLANRPLRRRYYSAPSVTLQPQTTVRRRGQSDVRRWTPHCVGALSAPSG